MAIIQTHQVRETMEREGFYAMDLKALGVRKNAKRSALEEGTMIYARLISGRFSFQMSNGDRPPSFGAYEEFEARNSR